MRNSTNQVVIDVAKIRDHIIEVVRNVYWVLDHCEQSVCKSRAGWPAQVAEDLSNAVDAALDVTEAANRLEDFVEKHAVAAAKLAKRAKKKGGRRAS